MSFGEIVVSGVNRIGMPGALYLPLLASTGIVRSTPPKLLMPPAAARLAPNVHR
jgi:hypothetical protein